MCYKLQKKENSKSKRNTLITAAKVIISFYKTNYCVVK